MSVVVSKLLTIEKSSLGEYQITSLPHGLGGYSINFNRRPSLHTVRVPGK